MYSSDGVGGGILSWGCFLVLGWLLGWLFMGEGLVLVMTRRRSRGRGRGRRRRGIGRRKGEGRGERYLNNQPNNYLNTIKRPQLRMPPPTPSDEYIKHTRKY